MLNHWLQGLSVSIFFVPSALTVRRTIHRLGSTHFSRVRCLTICFAQPFLSVISLYYTVGNQQGSRGRSFHASKEVGTETSLECSIMNSYKGCSQATAIRRLLTQDKEFHSPVGSTGQGVALCPNSNATLVQILQLLLGPLISHLYPVKPFYRKWRRQLLCHKVISRI